MDDRLTRAQQQKIVTRYAHQGAMRVSGYIGAHTQLLIDGAIRHTVDKGGAEYHDRTFHKSIEVITNVEMFGEAIDLVFYGAVACWRADGCPHPDTW